MSKFTSRHAWASDPFMPLAHQYQRAIDKTSKPDPPSNPPSPKKKRQAYYKVQVQNTLDYDLDIGYPILLGDLKYNTGTAAGPSQNGYYECIEPALENGNDSDLAIVLETIPQGKWGWAAISGIVYALTKGSSGKRASLLPDSDADHTSQLQRSSSGNIRVLGPIDDGCLIQLNGGGDSTAIVVFTLTAPLTTAGTTAAATVVADTSGALAPADAITVKGLIKYDAKVADTGIAVKIASEYIVLELPQGGGGGSDPSTILIKGKIDAGTSTPYGALYSETTAKVKDDSLVAITQDYEFEPFSEVDNPFKLNGAEDDFCIISKMPDDGNYILLAVIPQKAPIFFTASSDPTDDGGTNKFSITVNSYNGPGVPPTYVHDVHNIAFLLRSGGTGKAEWNQALGKWAITCCDKKTLWIRGKLYVGFDSQPATFDIDEITGVDGPPPEGPLTVQNTFKAEAADEDAEVVAMWNQAANDGAGQWEGRVACPAYTPPS